jgi:DNA-directed RNA polymerase specialized sigma24 family protein
MKDHESISKLLVALQAGDSSAAAEIYAHFLERARAVAEKRIHPQIQACVGASDIVQEGMKSALSFVRQGRLRNKNREEFEAILVTIIKRKAASAGKKVAAERLLQRDVPVEVACQGPNPEEAALRKESAAFAVEAVCEITQFLFRQREGAKSKHQAVRALIRVLGIVQELDAEEIWALLKEHFPENEPPAKRTIQLAVEDGRETLRKEFPL